MQVATTAFAIALFLFPNFAHSQVVNGDFSAGATGWTSNIPQADATLDYSGGQLTATSDDNGGGQSPTTADQTFTAPDPGFLSYTLRSYSSSDIADWDWPYVVLNGTAFRPNTSGALIASTQNIGGAITNATGASNVSGVTTLNGGSNTIGFGVFSQDSQLGSGIAVWDDIDFQEITKSPSAQSTIENYSLTLSGANAPQTATNTNDTITVTLSVSSGTVTLGSAGSVTITGGADGSSTVTFTGTPVNINTAMNGLIYTPNANFSGAETLVYSASGGGISDTDNIAINVTPGTSTITVSKTADQTNNIAAGVTVTYTYVVTNTGDQVISNISLSDAHNGSGPAPTPSNETLTSDNGTIGDSIDSGINGTWETLGPGDQVTFTATYIVTQEDVDLLQ